MLDHLCAGSSSKICAALTHSVPAEQLALQDIEFVPLSSGVVSLMDFAGVVQVLPQGNVVNAILLEQGPGDGLADSLPHNPLAASKHLIEGVLDESARLLLGPVPREEG